MKRITLLHFISVIVLLTSCGNSRPLRSDIKEFIASFSLSEAMKQYVNVEYKKEWEGFKDGVKEKQNIDLSYNIVDPLIPSYFYHEINYENDIKKSEITKEILFENEQLYYIENGTKETCEYKKCQDLINYFFYTYTEMEGAYHFGGAYYGDLYIVRARDYQDYVTIDKENSLLKFKRNLDSDSHFLNHEYILDNIGMLQSYSYYETNNSHYVRSQELLKKK